MFDNVLIGVDDHEAGRDALALATELVSKEGELHLVYVDVTTSRPAPDSGAAREARMQRFALERLTVLRDQAQVAAQVSCVEARSVQRGLHQFAASLNADLLVVGASRQDEVARIFQGDDAREALEDAPCAVAVPPPGYAAHSGAIRTIGVAYDGSRESARALALARELAAERHATLSAYEAVPAPVYARDPWNVEGEIADDVAAARQQVAALRDVEPHAEFADPPVEGLRRYGATVDLLVVGSHKYRPLDRLTERSTSQQLAENPPSPLLVLPSEDVGHRRST